MDKKKSVMISINGEKSKVYKSNHLDRSQDSHDEPMFNMHDTHDQSFNSSKQYPYPSYQKKSKKQRSSIQQFKPLLIAIFSAITIGLLLGFLMLVMFKGIGGDPIPDQSVATQGNENNEQDDQSEEIELTEKEQFQVKNMQAYVLQGGVFSEQENVEHWAEPYQNTGHPTMVWERDDQYYLFAGISSSRQQGKDDAEQLSDSDFDIFVKEWNTKQVELEMTKEEQDWMNSFQTLWEDSLQSVSADKGLLTDQWTQLADQSSFQSEHMDDFQEALKELLEDDSIDSDPFHQQQFLLRIWYQFEQMVRE